MVRSWFIAGASGGLVGAVARGVFLSDANHVGSLAEWAAAVGTVGALVYLARQYRDSSRVATLQADIAVLQAHNAMTALTLSMNDRFRGEPALTPFFVEDRAVASSDSAALRHEVKYAALAFADFVDTVVLHHKMLPQGHFDTWVTFCRDRISTSPAVRDHLLEGADWYSLETAALLRDALAMRESRANGG